MKKEKWKTFVTDRWKVAAPGLLAAFAVCFIFFIYAPLELYVTNQTEFWFDFYKILKAVLQNFALFFWTECVGNPFGSLYLQSFLPVRYGSGTGGFAYFICAGQFSGESYAAFRRHGNRMGGLPGRKYKDSDSVYSHSGSGRDRGKAAWCKEISGNLYGCECGTFGNPHDNACDDDCDHRGLPGENHLYM